MKHHHSPEVLLRARPQTSSVLFLTNKSNRAISSKPTRYNISSSLEKNLHRKSLNENEKVKFNNFLYQIE